MAFCSLDRVWEIIQGEIKIPWHVVHTDINDPCLVHGKDCDFWPAFIDSYKPEENFFIALSRYANKPFIVTNNLLPDLAGGQLEHPELDIKEIRFIRDGRKIVSSYLRKNPEKSCIEAITGFLQTSFSSFKCRNDKKHLCLRFEDVILDPLFYLRQIGDFVGLEYSEKALYFWEWQHHLTGGNPGTIAFLRLAEGLGIGEFESADFYRDRFRQMRESGPQAFKDDRDGNCLSRQDLFLFDCLAGADNARFGYERDRFSSEERYEFGKIVKKLVETSDISDYFAAQLAPCFSQ